jgi:hypothetical protein
LLERHGLLRGELAAIFIFRRGVGHLAGGPAGDFHPHRAPPGLNRRELALEGDLVFSAPVEADGGRLAEQQIPQSRHQIRTREHRQLHARAAFLHLHGNPKHIPCARSQQ